MTRSTRRGRGTKASQIACQLLQNQSLEKQVFFCVTEREPGRCPAADGYINLPNTRSAAVPRSWARRPLARASKGRRPATRREAVPPAQERRPTRRRPREGCFRLRPRTKFILWPVPVGARPAFSALSRARGRRRSRTHVAPSGRHVRAAFSGASAAQHQPGGTTTHPAGRRLRVR